MANITELKPTLLWKHFDAFCHIPRCSRNETAAGEYVKKFAANHGFESQQDDAGPAAETYSDLLPLAVELTLQTRDFGDIRLLETLQ